MASPFSYHEARSRGLLGLHFPAVHPGELRERVCLSAVRSYMDATAPTVLGGRIRDRGAHVPRHTRYYVRTTVGDYGWRLAAVYLAYVSQSVADTRTGGRLAQIPVGAIAWALGISHRQVHRYLAVLRSLGLLVGPVPGRSAQPGPGLPETFARGRAIAQRPCRRSDCDRCRSGGACARRAKRAWPYAIRCMPKCLESIICHTRGPSSMHMCFDPRCARTHARGAPSGRDPAPPPDGVKTPSGKDPPARSIADIARSVAVRMGWDTGAIDVALRGEELAAEGADGISRVTSLDVVRGHFERTPSDGALEIPRAEPTVRQLGGERMSESMQIGRVLNAVLAQRAQPRESGSDIGDRAGCDLTSQPASRKEQISRAHAHTTERQSEPPREYGDSAPLPPLSHVDAYALRTWLEREVLAPQRQRLADAHARVSEQQIQASQPRRRRARARKNSLDARKRRRVERPGSIAPPSRYLFSAFSNPVLGHVLLSTLGSEYRFTTKKTIGEYTQES